MSISMVMNRWSCVCACGVMQMMLRLFVSTAISVAAVFEPVAVLTMAVLVTKGQHDDGDGDGW